MNNPHVIAENRTFVSNLRRFEVSLVDPVKFDLPRILDDPGVFIESFDRTLAVVLSSADRVQVHQGTDLPPWEDRPPEAFGMRAALVENIRATWDRVGATPQRWLADYLRADATGSFVSLTDSCLRDPLFWWWITCGLSGLRATAVIPLERFDAKRFFSRVYGPTPTRGFETKSLTESFKYARRLTVKRPNVALVLHQARPSVVAGRGSIEGLFDVAVACGER